MGWFNINDEDEKLLRLVCDSLVNAGCCSVKEGDDIFNKLMRRPLRRWFLLRGIKTEMAAEGLYGSESDFVEGKIDWEAIADFLVKVAPVILEIIMTILSVL